MCLPTMGNWGKRETQLGSKDKVTANWETHKILQNLALPSCQHHLPFINGYYSPPTNLTSHLYRTQLAVPQKALLIPDSILSYTSFLLLRTPFPNLGWLKLLLVLPAPGQLSSLLTFDCPFHPAADLSHLCPSSTRVRAVSTCLTILGLQTKNRLKVGKQASTQQHSWLSQTGQDRRWVWRRGKIFPFSGQNFTTK